MVSLIHPLIVTIIWYYTLLSLAMSKKSSLPTITSWDFIIQIFRIFLRSCTTSAISHTHWHCHYQYMRNNNNNHSRHIIEQSYDISTDLVTQQVIFTIFKILFRCEIIIAFPNRMYSDIVCDMEFKLYCYCLFSLTVQMGGFDMSTCN